MCELIMHIGHIASMLEAFRILLR